MKRKRNLALWLLIAALVAIIAVGCYLSVTHQEARPIDSGAPGGAAVSP